MTAFGLTMLGHVPMPTLPLPPSCSCCTCPQVMATLGLNELTCKRCVLWLLQLTLHQPSVLHIVSAWLLGLLPLPCLSGSLYLGSVISPLLNLPLSVRAACCLACFVPLNTVKMRLHC
jgi:hypothetical protein